MEFKDLVAKLGLKVLNKELTPDDEGSVALTIDGMFVTLREFDEVGKILIYGEIGDVPPEGMEMLSVEMLKANHLFRATGGSTISLDEQAHKFYLCRYDDLFRLDQESFEKILENFVNVLEQWCEIIKNYHPDLSSKSEMPREAPTAHGLDSFMFLQA